MGAEGQKKNAALYGPVSKLEFEVATAGTSLQKLFLCFINELPNLSKLVGLSFITCTAFESKHFFNDHKTLDKKERSKNLACTYFVNPYLIPCAG